MSQLQWLTLMLKIGVISGFISLTGWIVLYTALAKWWHNPIGRTLVAKTLLIAGLFVPPILSLFFRLNPWVADWVEAALIGLVSPVMWWRSAVWLRLHRSDRLPRNGHDG